MYEINPLWFERFKYLKVISLENMNITKQTAEYLNEWIRAAPMLEHFTCTCIFIEKNIYKREARLIFKELLIGVEQNKNLMVHLKYCKNKI